MRKWIALALVGIGCTAWLWHTTDESPDQADPQAAHTEPNGQDAEVGSDLSGTPRPRPITTRAALPESYLAAAQSLGEDPVAQEGQPVSYSGVSFDSPSLARRRLRIGSLRYSEPTIHGVIISEDGAPSPPLVVMLRIVMQDEHQVCKARRVVIEKAQQRFSFDCELPDESSAPELRLAFTEVSNGTE